MADTHIMLKEVLRSNQLERFIAQEEKRGAGPADMARLDAMVGAAIKLPRSGDQTSRSREPVVRPESELL